MRLLKTIAYAFPINDEYKGIKEALKKESATLDQTLSQFKVL